MHFLLDRIGRCGLAFLLDACLVIGCICFLNRIGRCGLVFLLGASLVIGCMIVLVKLVVVVLRSC